MKQPSIAALLLVLLIGYVTTGTALAHASLVSSTPEDGATLDAVPETITLVFDEELSEQSGFTVVDTGGANLGEGKLDLNDLDRKTLSGTMAADAPSGTYTVNWVAVSADDDNREEGSISFTLNIQAPTAEPTAEPTVAPTTAPTAAPTEAPTEPAVTAAPIDTPQPTVRIITSPTSSNEPVQTDDDRATIRRQNIVIAVITVVGIVAAFLLIRRRSGS